MDSSFTSSAKSPFIVIMPFFSEIVIFSAAEEKTEQDVEILMSYVGGPEIATPGKEWIKHPLVSNEIIIKILK